MQAKTVVIVLLAALMLASCGAGVSPEESGAEFRSVAREMYSSLERPSCGRLQGFDRSDFLKDEAGAVRGFEAQARATPALEHLSIAREDAHFQISQGKDCWSDPSRSWALHHVKMTKDDVGKALPKLKALTPMLGELRMNDKGDQPRMAEFRDLVRRMLTGIMPLCPLTSSTSVSDKEILRPASDAVARLKEELADTRFSRHFAIAEADVAYETSNTIVECARPSTAAPKLVSQEIAAETQQQIAALRKIFVAR